MLQQGDVLLFQTNDDGDIIAENGLLSMSGGLETYFYLSLFGGNETDDVSADTPFNWWGNLSETEPGKQYRSRTQYLLRSIPAIPVNLRRIEDAVRADTQGAIDSGIVASITVAASIPAVNKVQIDITVNGDTTLTYVENWKAEV